MAGLCSSSSSLSLRRAGLAKGPFAQSGLARNSPAPAQPPTAHLPGWRDTARVAAGVLAGGLVALSAATAAEPPSLRPSLPPLDPRPEVAAVQREAAESWLIARQNFFDPAALAAADWDAQLALALERTSAAPDAQQARAAVASLLGALNDPYTRILRGVDLKNFKLNNDGKLTGVGLLVTNSDDGRLVVLRPLDDSPASRAGVAPGDEILSIDGAPLQRGMRMEDAASRLCGRSGSSVQLRLRHADSVPGAASRPPFARVRNLRLPREEIQLSPVTATPLTFVSSVDDALHTCGYVRLRVFSNNAARDIDAALAKLGAAGATDGLVLDLRGNPGGLVTAGLEVARTFLSAGDVIVSTLDRDGTESVVGLVPANANAGAAAAVAVKPPQTPLVVLIDGESASASEIVAGALRDNGRALLLGSKSYGKGKIQSVFELSDGSALFVTVATYRTPSGASIDRLGIQPDVACAAPADNDGALVDDPCIIEAESRLVQLQRRA